MKRRTFMAGVAASALLPYAAQAMGSMTYKPGLVDKELAAGKTVFLDFTTEWCTTCAAQKRAIASLKSDNPAYEQAITFVTVDFDQYRQDSLTQRLNIPRRSTLVVLKGNQELGRIVAGTSPAQIKGLLDTALGAATA